MPTSVPLVITYTVLLISVIFTTKFFLHGTSSGSPEFVSLVGHGTKRRIDRWPRVFYLKRVSAHWWTDGPLLAEVRKEILATKKITPSYNNFLCRFDDYNLLK